MKETSKRILAGILCAVLLVPTGCTAKEEEKKDTAKGRYLETEYTLPEKLEPLCMKPLEDGTIRMATAQQIYDSKDSGESWEPSKVQLSQAAQEEQEGLMNATIHTDGSMFFLSDKSCYYIDAAGTETKVNVDFPSAAGDDVPAAAEENTQDDDAENADDADFDAEKTLYCAEFTKDGKILGSSYAGMGYLIEPKTGELLKTFGEGTQISHFMQVGDRLLSLSSTGVSIYNMETGNIEESEPALSDFFSGLGESDEFYLGDSDKLITSAKEEDTLYYCNGTGLYRYKFGSSDMEMLINGSLTSMTNPLNQIMDIVELEDTGFLILYATESGVKLMNYTYSKEAAAVPEKELKIYGLQDNQTIRQAIANFQKDNPDYYITFETGMTGDDSVTISDAITNLNTNIMAGKGPDIILLDGMPVASYQEKGLLTDLTDVVEEVRKDKKFFDKILSSEASEDGLYAVPTRFLLPMIMGEEENINEVKDVKTLAEKVEKLRIEDADISSIIGEFNRETLTQQLLYNAIPQMMNEEGTINRDSLMGFLQDAKRIYDGNYHPADDEEEMVLGDKSRLYTNIMQFFIQMMNHQQKMSVGTISSLFDLKMVLAVNDKLEWSYGLQEVYIPQDIIGINAKSNDMEGSKAFVKYMLSEEMQSSSQAEGFPVSVDGLRASNESFLEVAEQGDSSIIGMSGDGGEARLDLRNPTSEEFDKFIASIEKLSEAYSPGKIIVDSVISETEGYFDGEIEADEAADKILKAVNLYLAEQ